jgi:hypothetical protein
MAAGLAAALARFATVIEGLGGGWTRNAQRLTGLADPLAIESGVDHTYWLDCTSHEDVPLVAGDSLTTLARFTVELGRRFGGGSAASEDYQVLAAAFGTEAAAIAQSLLLRTNWSFSSTGIVLVRLHGSGLEKPGSGPRMLIWTLDFTVRVRAASAAVAV